MARMIPSNVTHEEFHGSIGEERIYMRCLRYRMNMLCFIQFIGIRLGQVETSSGGSPISLFSTPTADYLLSR